MPLKPCPDVWRFCILHRIKQEVKDESTGEVAVCSLRFFVGSSVFLGWDGGWSTMLEGDLYFGNLLLDEMGRCS